MSTGLAEIRWLRLGEGQPLADRTVRFDQQLFQTALEGGQQGAVPRLISGFPLFSSGGHGSQHRHERAVCIFAVGQGVIERNADWFSVDLQGHGLRGDSCHGRGRCGCQASVVVRVAEHSITVVVIHMTTDAFADGWGERIGGHGKEKKNG